MPSEVRLQRIADRIREEVSQMLIREINDPRLHGIFITDVKVDHDLSYADVYISAIEGSERWEQIKSGLESASGFIRAELSARVQLRQFPRLRFHWDPTPENADIIEKLIVEIRKNERTS